MCVKIRMYLKTSREANSCVCQAQDLEFRSKVVSERSQRSEVVRECTGYKSHQV